MDNGFVHAAIIIQVGQALPAGTNPLRIARKKSNHYPPLGKTKRFPVIHQFVDEQVLVQDRQCLPYRAISCDKYLDLSSLHGQER